MNQPQPHKAIADQLQDALEKHAAQSGNKLRVLSPQELLPDEHDYDVEIDGQKYILDRDVPLPSGALGSKLRRYKESRQQRDRT